MVYEIVSRSVISLPCTLQRRKIHPNRKVHLNDCFWTILLGSWFVSLGSRQKFAPTFRESSGKSGVSGNDKRPGSREFKKLSEFSNSSLQWYESSQTLVFVDLLRFGAIGEGQMILDRSLLTSWTLDFRPRVFCRKIGVFGYFWLLGGFTGLQLLVSATRPKGLLWACLANAETWLWKKVFLTN